MFVKMMPPEKVSPNDCLISIANAADHLRWCLDNTKSVKEDYAYNIAVYLDVWCKYQGIDLGKVILDKQSKKDYGYHKREIPKGEFGKLSKVQEEIHEALDAWEQCNNIMLLQELSDIYGALREYLKVPELVVTSTSSIDPISLLELSLNEQRFDPRLVTYAISQIISEYGGGINDLKVMADATARAFETGERK